MALKSMSSDAGIQICQRSHKMFKWKGERSLLKAYAEVNKIYGKNQSSLCETVKEKNSW